jgi:Holliday junction DNA helicase RuvA
VEDLSAAGGLRGRRAAHQDPGYRQEDAERLVLELRDKLPKALPGARGDASAASADVVNALLGLGYNEREAQAAVKQLPPDLQLTDAIRHALKHLGKT